MSKCLDPAFGPDKKYSLLTHIASAFNGSCVSDRGHWFWMNSFLGRMKRRLFGRIRFDYFQPSDTQQALVYINKKKKKGKDVKESLHFSNSSIPLFLIVKVKLSTRGGFKKKNMKSFFQRNCSDWSSEDVSLDYELMKVLLLAWGLQLWK